MTIALSPQHSTSPLRSSPLAKPPWIPSKNGGNGNGNSNGDRDTKSQHKSTSTSGDSLAPSRAGEIPIPARTPIRTTTTGLTPSPSSPAASPTSQASQASPASPSSPLSRSHPLLGSYHLSLLHARMSAHAPHSVPSFSLRLKAVGVACPPSTPSHVRNPPPLDVGFKATYYDLAEGVNTPWVADVDLEGWYLGTYGAVDENGNGNGDGNAGGVPNGSSGSGNSATGLGITLSSSYSSPPSSPRMSPRSLSLSLGTSPLSFPTSPGSSTSSSSPRTPPLPPPPHYPGYRVPPVGQLQILVRTPSAPIKLFVLPFDLRNLGPGDRLFARDRTYVACASVGNNTPKPSSSSPSKDSLSRSPSRTAETLRYAVQLQFTCTIAPPEELAENPAACAYYVTKTLKLVFASRPPESSDPVRTERVDATAGPPECDKLEEWIRVRRHYLAVTRHGSHSKPSSPLLKKARLRPQSVRGFLPSPARDRPNSPTPIRPIASPRSLLSALDPRGDNDDTGSSAAGTGASAGSNSNPTSSSGSDNGTTLGTAVASALLAPVPRQRPSSLLGSTAMNSGPTAEEAAAAAIARATSPRPPSVADNGRRRRGSRAERELSERLRALEVRRLGDE